MSTPHEQPEPEGARSPEHAPQVVVRAGRTYICASCGTLVEIPADVIGQMVLAVDEAVAEKGEEASETQPATPPAPSKRSRPRRPKRPPQPTWDEDGRERIEGLIVPTGKEMDHALAWVTFHLKVLTRQDEEIRRLKKLLQQRMTQSAATASPRPRAGESPNTQSPGTLRGEIETYPHEDTPAAPKTTENNPHKRGPPS